MVVKTNHGMQLGTVKYFGMLHVAHGMWMGIDMDEAVGKHDGTVDGNNYFSAQPDHGVFSRPENVRHIAGASGLPESNHGSSEVLVEALKEGVVPAAVVRTYIFIYGIPDTVSRAMCWKLLLDYQPWDSAQLGTVLEAKRSLYLSFRSQLMAPDAASPADALFDTNVKEEITKDVLRTHSGLDFFYKMPPPAAQLQPEESHREVLGRILFVYAKLNPGIRYVQGMNEILAPLYFVFAKDEDPEARLHAESDAFFCFTNVMASLMDRFNKTVDDSSIGIMAAVNDMNALLQSLDPQLAEHMKLLGVDARFYAFRWLTLLLCQEFELPDTIRLWDTLFADEERFHFLTFCCVALLVRIRGTILNGDFSEIMQNLQSYPECEVRTILALATRLSVKARSKKGFLGQLGGLGVNTEHMRAALQDAGTRASSLFSRLSAGVKDSLVNAKELADKARRESAN